MLKERRDRSVSFDRYRASPLCRDSSPYPIDKYIKEWEEARCSVCMDHPHNCILLICSSYENGCRPYMCDTSYRHSNCFDQFCKASKETKTEVVRMTNRGVTNEDKEKDKPKLRCPLCRGHVKKWVVEKEARRFLDSKLRSCSCETCDYSGTYSDLTKHARVKHPNARPSEADPKRKISWRRLERRRDLGDMISLMRSCFWWLTRNVTFPRRSGSSSSSLLGTSRARPEVGDRRNRSTSSI